MNLKHIVFSLAIISLLTACTGDLTPEEMQQKIISANKNLKSYTADIDSRINMSTVTDGKPLTIRSDTAQKGLIDRENRKVKVSGSTKTAFSGMTINMDTETYIIGGTVYVKMMNTWMRMDLGNEMWDQQDQVEQTVMLLQSGSVEKLPDEDVDGESYYVFSIEPDIRKVAELALKQQESSGLAGENIDYADMIRKYDATIHVNKDSFIIERQKMDLSMVLTAENMGRNETNTSDITMDMSVDVKMYDINKKVEITLPAEADDAEDYTELRKSQGGNSITGNVINEAFT